MRCETLGERYLAHPGSFPAWEDGDPYGPVELSMEVCGSGFRVSGLSVMQERTVRDLWPGFVKRGAHAPTPLTVLRTPADTFRKLERWIYELDFDYREHSLRLVGLDIMARLGLAPSFRAALWLATEEPGSFRGAFENFLRVVTAYATLQSGGVLVHSAAVADGDDAWLFVGHSGAGKSTVSRLGRDSGKTVLSDDLNPILPNTEGGIDVVGSPFLGDLGARSPTRHRLSGIYRLEQGSEDAVRPMGSAEMLASLLACSPYVNRDPHRIDALTSNLMTLTERLPAHVLTFRRHGTFWPLLERRALVRG